MFDSHLIIVDGLPGSGKSTTAQWLELQLQRNGIPARRFYLEAMPHQVQFVAGTSGLIERLECDETRTAGGIKVFQRLL